MRYDVYNPNRSARIFFDGIRGSMRQIRVEAGKKVEGVALGPATVDILSPPKGDLILTLVDDRVEPELPDPILPGQRERNEPRPSVMIDGMWGIGDNLHQRAPIRALMKTHDVWLSTCHHELYHDLVEQGLHLVFKATRLRAQARTIERERGMFRDPHHPPRGCRAIKLWYRKDQIDRYGSILGSMMAECGVSSPAPDFSMPVKPEWTAKARSLIASWEIGDKPLMLYRPVVLRREWNSASRNPDPAAYARIFEAARHGFFVVSIADLQDKEEWIVGPEQDADVKLHRGELDFPTIAALFREAHVGFFNAGFAPVLAQAVGLPAITVYGGRESYRTTQKAGAHLAPTLGIDPIRPCDCHTENHSCDKRIDVPVAVRRAVEFSNEYRIGRGETTTLPSVAAATPTPPPGAGANADRALIFATTYCDCPEREKLTEQWLRLTTALNPDCDILIVDSASPHRLFDPKNWPDFRPYEPGRPSRFMVYDFGDNVGHLSRGGKDGWGRAFCEGLDIAVAEGYDWVFHIEGDSLFRIPARDVFAQMAREKINTATIPVKGMIRDIPGWVETGLMAFSVPWLKASKFTKKYDWPARQVSPTPEIIVERHCRDGRRMMPWKGLRGDKAQITHENIVSLDLDWVTHCHNDIWAYNRFIEANLPVQVSRAADPSPVRPATGDEEAEQGVQISRPEPLVRLNLGCGTNKLPGWANHDADVDITKRLPWADGAADFIFIEHCVEHVSYHQAVAFFEEAFRVLKPGGVLRVVVPSIEQIAEQSGPDYWEFTRRWGGEATLKGALRSIIFAHGHQQAWTASLMRATLAYAGFSDIAAVMVGQSAHAALRGLEGHGKVIGEKFNAIESMAFEATKGETRTKADSRDVPDSVQDESASLCVIERKVAVVVGGGGDPLAEVEKARELCAASGARPVFFVINDMIPNFPGEIVAVTLHPTKLREWLRDRTAKGHPSPTAIWAHRKGEGVTNVIDDWSGSSGLFSVHIARHLGFDRILLCGVPMAPEGNHFLRRVRWNAAFAFRKGWERRKPEIAPYVRSFSGWTRDLLGAPDAAFIR
jgi:SAM-dependent methyltransferase